MQFDSSTQKTARPNDPLSERGVVRYFKNFEDVFVLNGRVPSEQLQHRYSYKKETQTSSTFPSIKSCINGFSEHWNSFLWNLENCPMPADVRKATINFLSEDGQNKFLAYLTNRYFFVHQKHRHPQQDLLSTFHRYTYYDVCVSSRAAFKSVDLSGFYLVFYWLNSYINYKMSSNVFSDLIKEISMCFWISRRHAVLNLGVTEYNVEYYFSDDDLSRNIIYILFNITYKNIHGKYYSDFFLREDKVNYAAENVVREIERNFPNEMSDPSARQHILSEIFTKVEARAGEFSGAHNKRDYAATVDDQILPPIEQAPELYRDRPKRMIAGELRKELPDEFLKRVYKDWLTGALLRPHIKNLDKSLYQALYRQGFTNDLDEILPKAAGLGGGAKPKYSDSELARRTRENTKARVRRHYAKKRNGL